MPHESDENLSVLARAGDESALLALFEAQRPRLKRMITLRLEPELARRVDVTDIVQDAWLQAKQRFAAWRERTELPVHVWLRLVAMQALVDARRHHLQVRMRAAGRETPLHESRASISAACLGEAFITSATTPTRAAQREELRTRVVAALERLDELDREIVTLRHFESISNDDAALLLGIEPAAASKRYMRALARLRPVLRAIAPGATERDP